MSQVLEWIAATEMLLYSAVVTLWLAGAIYYDVCSETKWGRFVALGWAIVVILMFVVWQPFAMLLGVAAIFLGWWLSQKPSHHREWDPSVALGPL